MKHVLSLAAIALLALGAIAARADGDGDRKPPRPPDILLFIGDGMGPNQVTLGREVKGAPLAMDSIKQAGLCKNDSASGTVTDSAAAITAIACGVKTKNRTLGVDVEGKPVDSVAVDLKARGYQIGLVTTTRITHATPAGFYAHSTAREDEKLIASQLIDSRVDVAIGGGRPLFRVGPGNSSAGKYEEAFVSYSLPDPEHELLDGVFKKAPPAPRNRVLSLLADSHLPFEIDRVSFEVDREHGTPSLETMTAVALAMLSHGGADRLPFFLMVEGGRIDHACHGHDAATEARELIAFDDAVAKGLAFARAHGALFLVTADHATGGMSISEHVDLAGLRRVRCSAGAMLAEAKGDADRLRAIVEEKAGVTISAEEAQASVTRKHKLSNDGTLADLLSRRRGVYFAYPLDDQETMTSAEGHDATMVPMYAEGPFAERLGGTIDNTDIARVIREVARETARNGSREF